MTASDSRLALWSLRIKPVPELLISASILSKYSLLNAQPFSSDRVRLKTLCASSTTMTRFSWLLSGWRERYS